MEPAPKLPRTLAPTTPGMENPAKPARKATEVVDLLDEDETVPAKKVRPNLTVGGGSSSSAGPAAAASSQSAQTDKRKRDEKKL